MTVASFEQRNAMRSFHLYALFQSKLTSTNFGKEHDTACRKPWYLYEIQISAQAIVGRRWDAKTVAAKAPIAGVLVQQSQHSLRLFVRVC